MAEEQNKGWFWRLKALGDRVEENNAYLNQVNNQNKSNIQSNNQVEVEEPSYRLDNKAFGGKFLPDYLAGLPLPEGVDPDKALRALTRFQEGKLVWNPQLRKYLKAFERGDEAAVTPYGQGQGLTWKDAYDMDQGVYDESSGYGAGGEVILSEEDEEAIKEGEKNLSLMQIASPHIGSFAQGIRDYYREGSHEPYKFQFFGQRARDDE